MGLATGYGAASRLLDLVGKAKAQKLLFFCETLSATEAVADGLVHRVIDDITGMIALLIEIAALEPLALAAQKRMLHLGTTMPAGDPSWADHIFAGLWRNPTHARNLNNFKKP